jgi:hypothetical protein
VGLDRDHEAHVSRSENVECMLAICRTKLEDVISGNWCVKVWNVLVCKCELLPGTDRSRFDVAGEVVEANIMVTGNGKSKGCGYDLITNCLSKKIHWLIRFLFFHC